MNIIVPMAGMGKRMRPHTFTTPKPLIPIAGKPIVQRLVEEIVAIAEQPIDEIAFIISPNFGKEVEDNLLEIASNLGSKGVICYQKTAEGTAHAVYSAKEQLNGEVIVGFADTLFKADFKISDDADGVIWVQRVEDPSAFGVVKLDDNGVITDFIEKPETFVSDLAIIGIYYFKDGEALRNEIKYLLDNDIREKGEYQLTNALENLKQKGVQFKPGEVTEWMDCGNKNATVHTNARILALTDDEDFISGDVQSENSEIIEPCFIGSNVKLKNAKIGPFVSVGAHTVIENAEVDNSILQKHVTIKNAKLTNSMVGNHARYDGKSAQVSIGDYSTQED